MLSFRPHHFLCTLGFEGKGYSDAFTRNMAEIAASLRARGAVGDAVPIRVTMTADSLCTPCPHKRGEGCETDEKIRKLDEAHSLVLDLQPGQVLTWGEAKDRIVENMTVEAHHAACAPCAWREMGMCEAALQRLLDERAKPTPTDGR